MEQIQNTDPSLFNLSIDPLTRADLLETAKWARFLAIVGFVFLGLMLVGGVALTTYMATSVDTTNSEFGSAGMLAGIGVGMVIFYILIAALWFFPLLFLMRFANRMRLALYGNDQQALNLSVQNLKVFFRYIGIITIIVLSLYALVFIVTIVGFAAFA
jgi:hypothetical protein